MSDETMLDMFDDPALQEPVANAMESLVPAVGGLVGSLAAGVVAAGPLGAVAAAGAWVARNGTKLFRRR